jgi:3'-phosphoadenosine 5'-phosphosulfate sulfotransferase (PAPS reductase)/FAD synthetase
MRYIIDEPSARAAEELDTNSYVIGLRREESIGRSYTGAVHGSLYSPLDGGLTRIAPLLKWTWKDVWAATVLFDLPVHPAYCERLEGESLKNTRVGVITDLASEHTPATLARFKERNPAGYAALKASAPEAPWPH